MSQCSQVSWIALCDCSLNVSVLIFVFVFVLSLQYFSCPMAAVCLLCSSHLAFVFVLSLQYFSCPLAAVCLLCLSHLAFVWHVTSGGGWLGAVIDGNLLHYQLIIKPGQMSRCCPVATSVPPRCPAELQNLSKHFNQVCQSNSECLGPEAKH